MHSPQKRALNSSGGGASLSQYRVGRGECFVGEPEDLACCTRCLSVDEISHDLEGDLCNGVGAHRHAQTRLQNQGMANQEAEAAAGTEKGIEPLANLDVVTGSRGYWVLQVQI